MKKKILIVLSLFFLFVLSACDLFQPIEENNSLEGENFSYEIEQIQYAKTFEQIEPTIHATQDGENKIRLSINIGVSDSTNIEISSIKKMGSIVHVKVKGEHSNRSDSLSTPIIYLTIRTNQFKASDVTYNVINDEVNVYSIKYSLSDMINLLETKLKLSTKTLPSTTLTKGENGFFWNVYYHGIVDKDDPNLSLIHLNAKVDAQTGEILSSNKEIISNLLDNGKIMGMTKNDALYYKKNIATSTASKSKLQLWKYDIKTQQKEVFFETDFEISAFQLSNDGSKVAFIEKNDVSKSIYISNTKDLKPYKLTLDSMIQPAFLRWSPENLLYIISYDKTFAPIYIYDEALKQLSLKTTLSSDLKDMIFGERMLALLQKHSDSKNCGIYVGKNLEETEKIATGSDVQFINDRYLSFQYINDVDSTRTLYLYDLEKRQITDFSEKDISSVLEVDDKTLSFTQRRSNYNNYVLFAYNIRNQERKKITDLISTDAYYDPIRQTIYQNVFFSVNEGIQELIYYLELK